ncbi:sulfite exporter TauE/SafE family protein [Fodinicurvata sp. EGI_FJ10296]|uniref:sulfite exporter TauE/SafE family protein n=1 Tax=Fodinicurvata sp. EGI_FJ10296 TaxID=3231908 RepID=UPI0034543683
MIEDPIFYLLAVPAVLIAGISKGGLGGGLGIVAVPMMALAIGPVQAAAIMLPILCVMDLHGLWLYAGQWSRPNMATMIPGAMVGTVVGTLSFQYLDPAAIQLLIGIIALAFVAYRFAPVSQVLVEQPAGGKPLSGVVWGAVSGFTSFVAHAGGPPASVHLLPQRLHKTEFVGTTVVFFTVVNYVKLVPYWFLDQFPVGNLMTAGILLPLAPLGMWVGWILHHRISQGWFYAICYVFLTITGVKLTWDGIVALVG